MRVTTLQNRWFGRAKFRQGVMMYYRQQIYRVSMPYTGPVGTKIHFAFGFHGNHEMTNRQRITLFKLIINCLCYSAKEKERCYWEGIHLIRTRGVTKFK